MAPLLPGSGGRRSPPTDRLRDLRIWTRVRRAATASLREAPMSDPTRSDGRSTTGWGAPAPSDRNTLSVGRNGPLLLHDVHFLEQMAHFNREKVPERQPHAKGGGAFGFFETTEDVSQFTKAAVFQKGARTDLLIRFSTVAGEMGSPRHWRDVRGFSLKLYTSEGNYDIVGNNTPIFFIRDPMKFPHFIRSQKRLPDSGLRDNHMQWDFWTLNPESAHQVTYLMGDRGLPRTWRHMNGYGSHTFMWVNGGGERFWVKYHFKTDLGWESFTNDEAAAMAGADADFHRRDLFEAIARGEHPTWTLKVQVMPYEDAKDYRFNPFDLTKVWPHGDYPLIDVGEFELNRNPENYFADVEQAAFNPANVVPGIGFSPDRMLQGRLFSYGDAQRYRLGVNHYQIPVNKPQCPFHNPHRDGAMRVDGNEGSTLHYEPNSYDQWKESKEYVEPASPLEGDAFHYDHREDDDYYTQPGNLFRIMSPEQQQVLFENTARNMNGAAEFIQKRHIGNCYKADPEYGKGVAKALNIDIKDVDLS